MHKKHSGTEGKLKEDSKSADTADDYSTIKINNQSLEIMKKNYLGDTREARGGILDIVITRIKSGWFRFRNVVPLFPSRDLPTFTCSKGRLHFACACMCVVLHGSNTWPVKEQDAIRH